MKAMIFGANGQDGFYLNQLLVNLGVEVLGFTRHKNGQWLVGDVADLELVEKSIKSFNPDFIFHLAANSTTKHEAIFENHETISTGTLNILESVRLHSPRAKVFLSGSAMQFKNIGKPIDESTPFEASSPYSVARIQSVYAGRYFRAKFGLSVYVGYFFNHDSPLRDEHHINKKITEAVKRIAAGSNEKIEIGDLKVKKEFNFAGDIVKAVWLLVNQDAAHEAIIGSGQAYSIEDFVKYCFNKITKNWRDYVVAKPNHISEYQILVSNPKLIKSLGWSPEVSFEKLADLMLGIK